MSGLGPRWRKAWAQGKRGISSVSEGPLGGTASRLCWIQGKGTRLFGKRRVVDVGTSNMHVSCNGRYTSDRTGKRKSQSQKCIVGTYGSLLTLGCRQLVGNVHDHAENWDYEKMQVT